MRKRGKNIRNCGGKQKARHGTRALALVATFALVASMFPGTVALAYANEQYAADLTGASQFSVQAETVSGNTHAMKDGVTYKVDSDVTIEADGSGNGIKVDAGAKVRPWFTPAESTDGEFPEWFTHWGSEGRPTTDRRSSAVVYTQGADDGEGLVGYHTNADGSLEKVTAEKVYVWVNGVDVDGEHVAVESGDKVWYKTDKGGWKVPLAVQREAPEGAEGYVVARDYAWADKLGVRDAGTYKAYALFDEGTGFETTALARATVEVRAAENPMAAKGRTFSAPVGKKTVYAKAAAFKISKAKGAVTFEKVSGSKRVSVTKAGKVTVKKGLKKGEAYKVKVKVTAAGDGNYKKASKTVTVTVKVA